MGKWFYDSPQEAMDEAMRDNNPLLLVFGIVLIVVAILCS